MPVPLPTWTSAKRTSTEPARQWFDTGVVAVRVKAKNLGTPVVLRPFAGCGPVIADGTGSRAQQRHLDDVLRMTPQRVVVHGGVIYSVTQAGVAAHSSTFQRLAFARF